MHSCKLLVTKLYTAVLGKRLANSRLQIVGDKPVNEVRGDLRDTLRNKYLRDSCLDFDKPSVPISCFDKIEIIADKIYIFNFF